MKKLLGGIFLCAIACLALAADQPNVAEANNSFAFELVNHVLRGQSNQNVFVSPYSVSIALQMLCNGASGKTLAQMEETLKTRGLPQQEINGFYKDLNKSLTSQSNIVLDLSNSIWIDKGFEIKPAFIFTNEAYFGANLGTVNFETPESAETINEWAANSTRGKIKGIVAFPFPANTEMVLANALYFKGAWAKPFDKKRTQKRYFYVDGNMIKQTPMMFRRAKFDYAEGDGYQAVELPYAGNRLQMIVFLPVTNSSPAKLLSRFNGTNWNDKILPQFGNREGTLILPKFKLNFQVLLNDPLQSMGMQDPFISGTANFAGISSDPIFVGEVLQKSFVDVNEEGTEAAAVTTVIVRSSALMRPLKPFEMVVDRPFLFLISDRATGIILFMGIVNDPAVGM